LLRATIKRDVAKWTRVVTEMKITAN